MVLVFVDDKRAFLLFCELDGAHGRACLDYSVLRLLVNELVKDLYLVAVFAVDKVYLLSFGAVCVDGCPVWLSGAAWLPRCRAERGSSPGDLVPEVLHAVLLLGGGGAAVLRFLAELGELLFVLPYLSVRLLYRLAGLLHIRIELDELLPEHARALRKSGGVRREIRL